MADKEPTQEQRQEVLEGCGFEKIEYLDTNEKVCGVHWAHPEAIGGGCSSFPDVVDLKFLFKYAVPVAITKLAKKKGGDTYLAKWSLIILWMEQWDIIKDPALALFWAIWEVPHNG